MNFMQFQHFLELITDEVVIAKITSFHRSKIHVFLFRFADVIYEKGLDIAVAYVKEL